MMNLFYRVDIKRNKFLITISSRLLLLSIISFTPTEHGWKGCVIFFLKRFTHKLRHIFNPNLARIIQGQTRGLGRGTTPNFISHWLIRWWIGPYIGGGGEFNGQECILIIIYIISLNISPETKIRCIWYHITDYLYEMMMLINSKVSIPWNSVIFGYILHKTTVKTTIE